MRVEVFASSRIEFGLGLGLQSFSKSLSERILRAGVGWPAGKPRAEQI